MNIINNKLQFNAMTYGNKPNTLIVHHIEAEGSTWTVNFIHNMHKNDNGWAGIGYHYYIRLDGTVYKGRPDNAIGSHCKGSNTNSLGIAFEGDYDKRTIMPESQYTAWCELKTYLVNLYGSMPVYGHREKGSSACPGKYFPLTKVKSATIAKYTVGWHRNDIGWYYYADTSGSYYTTDNGWKLIDGDWYIFDKRGYALVNQWYKGNDGKWYYLNYNCKMVKSMWIMSNSKWYYFKDSGAMVTNDWIQSADKVDWYYVGDDGAMVTNSWITWKSKKYYLTDTGKMATNTTIDNIVLGPDGVAPTL